MTGTKLPLSTLLLLILPLVACSPVTEPESEGYRGGPEYPPTSDPVHNHMAIVEYHSMDTNDPSDIEKYAKARVVVLNPHVMWDPGANPNVMAEMRAINPDVKIIGYFNSQTTWLRWESEEGARAGTFENDWAVAMRPYWSYSTTGDTMLAWPGKVVLDILNPVCRQAMVGVLAEHWSAYSNTFDGIFWDHFNRELWVKASVEGREGDLDLDGDGIAHLDDEDEIQAYRDASVDLILDVRRVLGSDVIQIANGARAAYEADFAALLDGAMYEHFPDVGFAPIGMPRTVDPGAPNNLFTAREWFLTDNGGPFLILSNTFNRSVQFGDYDIRQLPNAEFCRVIALLTDNLVSYHTGAGVTNYGWPTIELDLGAPLGEAVIAGDQISRNFDNGRVDLDFTAAIDGAPFGFSITQDDDVVQSVNFATN